MQQQDNDFPIDQIQSGSNPPDSGIAGGTTFQPQVNGQSSAATPNPTLATPSWQQAAAGDATALYQQSEAPAGPTVNPITPPTINAAAVPNEPPANSAPGLVIPEQNASQPPAAMQQDFNQANQITTSSPTSSVESPAPTEPTPMPAPTPPEPMVTPAPAPVDTSALSASPMLGSEPAVPMPSPNLLEIGTAQTPGLPGADQLGRAAVGMDQPTPASTLDPNLAGIDPMAANVEGMGAYGPPPSSKKKLILIIAGAIVGIILIGVIILVIVNSSARKPAQNLNPTSTEETTPTTPTPTSGPATPPQGYITIEKQCYTFALYDPNSVPADQACSFKDATFGKLKTSKISVISTTEAYKNLDEFVNAIKPTITVTSQESIKLDNFDAKQLIYKASDGKTYSRVLALIVGKNYQQDGKAVTGIDITTSYQDDFDKTVTKNVLDTWRWK